MKEDLNLRVLLIFRDSKRGGKSVESIFDGLYPLLDKQVDLLRYEYLDHKSLIYNYRRIMELGANLFHITSDIYWLSFLLPANKCVITIHDIGHYLGMKGIRKWIYKRIFILWPAMRSGAITTVSHFTYQTLSQILPKKSMNKIIVIPNPVPPCIDQSMITKVPGNKIILQVGTSPHKNCETVIQALRGLPYKLHIVGPLSIEQLALLQSMNIQFIQSQSATYNEVMEAYRGADAITFISSFEGFGMPIIEAQATGRPVITSKNASLPEVAGKGAHYIEDIKSIEEVKGAIFKVMEDTLYREHLVEEGLINVKRFEIEGIAKKYAATYKEVSANKGFI